MSTKSPAYFTPNDNANPTPPEWIAALWEEKLVMLAKAAFNEGVKLGWNTVTNRFVQNNLLVAVEYILTVNGATTDEVKVVKDAVQISLPKRFKAPAASMGSSGAPNSV